MGFRPERIGATPIALRERDVDARELPDEWFDDPTEKTIRVRQLTGNEVTQVQAAVAARNLRAALAEAIASGSESEIAAAGRAALGSSGEIQPAYVRKLETVRLACVPPLDDAQAAEVGEKYAIVLERLHDAIWGLVGQGGDPEKKPASSTATPASG